MASATGIMNSKSAQGEDVESKDAEMADVVNSHKIGLLQEHGINVSDIKKLEAAGICSVEALQMTTKKEICNIRGITEARCANLLAAGEKISIKASGKFRSASQLKQEHSIRYHISTGSGELDNILGGGMESSSLTELIGEYRTGKTQLCHTLCVSAQLGQNAGKVIFVDTEGTFRPDRLKGICTRYGVDPEVVLENIIYTRLFNTDQMMDVPDQVEAIISEEETSFSLMIIDSLMALWRSDYSGRGELAPRQQALGRFLNKVKQISERHNIAIVYTNLVMSDPGADESGMSYVNDPKKAVGGHVVAHASTTRLMLRKGRDNERVAKIIDSPTMAEEEARFLIGDQGIFNE